MSSTALTAYSNVDKNHTEVSTFATLADDIHIIIIKYMQSIDKVCLALSSHRLYHLVLTTTKKDRLGQIVPNSRTLELFRDQKPKILDS